MKDCVSLEMARKLKEVGWEQSKAAFVYRRNAYGWSEVMPGSDGNEEWCAAPSIGELLEALPEEASGEKGTLTLGKVNGDYRAIILGFDGQKYLTDLQIAPNPADALAALWIALKAKNPV